MCDSILNSPGLHERLWAGDDDAFIILYQEGLTFLKPFFKSKGFVNEAEDLWSEIFIRLLRTLCSSFNPKKGSFKGWLFTIGKNLATDIQRKREGEVPLDDRLGLAAPEQSTEEERGGSRYLEVLVKRAEASLKPDDRIILSLRIVEALSFDLIADELGIPYSTAAMRARRALERLFIEMERLSTRELPRRIRRPERKNSGRVVSATYQKQRKSSGSK